MIQGAEPKRSGESKKGEPQEKKENPQGGANLPHRLKTQVSSDDGHEQNSNNNSGKGVAVGVKMKRQLHR